jgi:hypothetical protein
MQQPIRRYARAPPEAPGISAQHPETAVVPGPEPVPGGRHNTGTGRNGRNGWEPSGAATAPQQRRNRRDPVVDGRVADRPESPGGWVQLNSPPKARNRQGPQPLRSADCALRTTPAIPRTATPAPRSPMPPGSPDQPCSPRPEPAAGPGRRLSRDTKQRRHRRMLSRGGGAGGISGSAHPAIERASPGWPHRVLVGSSHASQLSLRLRLTVRLMRLSCSAHLSRLRLSVRLGGTAGVYYGRNTGLPFGSDQR